MQYLLTLESNKSTSFHIQNSRRHVFNISKLLWDPDHVVLTQVWALCLFNRKFPDLYNTDMLLNRSETK